MDVYERIDSVLEARKMSRRKLAEELAVAPPAAGTAKAAKKKAVGAGTGFKSGGGRG